MCNWDASLPVDRLLSAAVSPLLRYVSRARLALSVLFPPPYLCAPSRSVATLFNEEGRDNPDAEQNTADDEERLIRKRLPPVLLMLMGDDEGRHFKTPAELQSGAINP